MVYSEVDQENSNVKQMFLYLQHRTYVHIFDFVWQDWFAVVSILEREKQLLPPQGIKYFS